MNDVIASPVGSGASKSDRDLLLIAYVLYGIAPFVGGITAVAGVIINHIKLGEITDPFLRSHHAWMMRTFWWSLLWSVISFVLCFVAVGVVTFAILFFWYLYRVIRGVLAMNELRPMP